MYSKCNWSRRLIQFKITGISAVSLSFVSLVFLTTWMPLEVKISTHCWSTSSLISTVFSSKSIAILVVFRQLSCCSSTITTSHLICARPRREGDSKCCFCPPVCPSVGYIANNSRTQMPSVPKFGRKIPHLRCDSHISFKVKWSKIRVTRPINTETHHAPYLPNGKGYELQTWYTDEGRRPASAAAGAVTSKVKGQGHKLTSSVRLISASS